MQKIYLSSLMFVIMSYLHAGVELDYLNTLRTKTGMPPFINQSSLTAAAQNHSAYMQTNNTSGHGEISTDIGYTGATQSDRALYAGYGHVLVSENVSTGSGTYQRSIDGLMSAIYHRFGFLSLERDEIGIGISNDLNFYTYDMGNSKLRDLCVNSVYTGGSYYLPCADSTKKINSTDYLSISSSIKSATPSLILWPTNDSIDVPPVFYEESPDPLPTHGVTGYPISIEFNTDKFTTAPSMLSFTLEDESTVIQNSLIEMQKSNDPNLRFSEYQFALFPEKRLEWGSPYNVEFIYTYNNQQSIENWCFETRTLKGQVDRFYRIEQNADVVLNVVSGQSYAIYIVPNNTNDILGGLSYSYTVNPNFEQIDYNTFKSILTGTTGQYVQYTFSNGQKVKLVIASADTATVPKDLSCGQINDYDNDGILDIYDLDDDNDGYSDVDEIKAGSDPRDSTDVPLDTDKDMIANIIDTDDDNDGISDIDEVANGLDPLNAADGEADFDNDGFSNALEISIGSNLRDATSKPIWVPLVMGDIVTMIPYFK